MTIHINVKCSDITSRIIYFKNSRYIIVNREFLRNIKLDSIAVLITMSILQSPLVFDFNLVTQFRGIYSIRVVYSIDYTSCLVLQSDLRDDVIRRLAACSKSWR
ncbi:hypothetical protein D3C73_1074100 [compost metagenome]